MAATSTASAAVATILPSVELTRRVVPASTSVRHADGRAASPSAVSGSRRARRDGCHQTCLGKPRPEHVVHYRTAAARHVSPGPLRPCTRPAPGPAARASRNLCPRSAGLVPGEHPEEQPSGCKRTKLAPQILLSHAAPSFHAAGGEPKATPHRASVLITVIDQGHLTKHPNGGSPRRFTDARCKTS